MPEFDQATWKRTTTWPGAMPTPGQLWGKLQHRDLPEAFRETVVRCAATSRMLRAGLAQGLSGRGLPEREVARRMGEVTGRRHPVGSIARLLPVRLRRAEWKIRFTNLVSGRFTELVFERAFREPLSGAGLDLIEEVAQRTFLDYRVTDGTGFEVAINLKNAGVQYRDSMRWVGLPPEDTLPIATYKIFGSEVAGIPPLIYVYLVDWTLLDRLRASYWIALSPNERDLFRLMACAHDIPWDVQDGFIEATVGGRLDRLLDGVGYGTRRLAELPFRAISAARCRRLFYDDHGRSPYVYRQRMNTDPNVHISVERETLPFAEFLDRYLATPDARRRLLAELRRTAQVTIPAPGI